MIIQHRSRQFPQPYVEEPDCFVNSSSTQELLDIKNSYTNTNPRKAGIRGFQEPLSGSHNRGFQSTSGSDRCYQICAGDSSRVNGFI